MPRRVSFICLTLAASISGGCDLFKEPTKKVAEAPPAEPAPAAEPEMETVKAGVGVGKKGASLRGDDVNQVIAGPAVDYFNTREKVVFEIAIPHAMNLFNAENGYFPRSHEEFMEKIVEANQIQLPQLPEGARYVYDVESHTLMVERPKAQGEQ
jgi:hypothetical protein